MKATQFPTLIKNKRKQLDLSQAEFGEMFGVSHAAVSDWESGKSEAPYKVLGFVLSDQTEVVCQYCGDNPKMACSNCPNKKYQINNG